MADSPRHVEATLDLDDIAFTLALLERVTVHASEVSAFVHLRQRYAQIVAQASQPAPTPAKPAGPEPQGKVTKLTMHAPAPPPAEPKPAEANAKPEPALAR